MIFFGSPESTAAIDKADNRLLSKASEIRAEWSTKTLTPENGAPAADHWYQVARQFAETAESMSRITDEQVRTAGANAHKLAEIRDLLSVRKGKGLSYAPGSNIHNMFVLRLVAPIDWLRSVMPPVLQRQAAIDDLVEGVANAPSSAVGYLLEQLRKALKLPTWFVPVAATAGALGVGAWAYFTFLEPARRVSRRVT